HANRVKSEDPIMVVLGNPPYSGHSANQGKWMHHLLRGKDIYDDAKTESYFEIGGKKLEEKNPKWLNDDYVKFIRFAQWRIEKTGHGVLAFITNNGYFDNPTFRGMRESLLKTFDDIYVLDLHGSSKKKEKAPDGGKDENVFDIQQGVGIGIFVRKQGADHSKPAQVRHADLYGKREVRNTEGELKGGKYHWLERNSVGSTKWSKPKPEAPYLLFKPVNRTLAKEYQGFHSLSEAMPVNSVGIVTARDSLTIHFDRESLWETIKRFTRMEAESARTEFALGADVRDWKVSWAQEDLIESGLQQNKTQAILYRPFDIRTTYYSGKSRGFHCYPRAEVMQHMLKGENLGLMFCRQVVSAEWCHCVVTRSISDDSLVSNKTRERGYLAPLYIYPNGKEHANLFEHDNGRRPNFSGDFVALLQSRLKGINFVPDEAQAGPRKYTPRDVFNYLYGVLHAPSYRERYEEFLAIDFPRVPITSKVKLFRRLAELGSRLTLLHTMEEHGKKAYWPAGLSFQEGDLNLIEKVTFRRGPTRDAGRVYINASQFFEGVPEAVWDFHIGGYRVAEKWLKDRKGRTISSDDHAHYRSTIAALRETVDLMAALDDAIDAEGGWPKAFE
ncbi:MAG: DNA methyltransferase, partial [Planctomycetes bacterium]|nr:DNA methyltransferase [Planctomycetota bacterium]